MSFVISIRWIGTVRHPHSPQTRSLASNVIIALSASLFDPLSFIHTTHGVVIGASKTPFFAVAEAVITERRNKYGRILWLSFVQFSYFYFRLLASVVPRGTPLNLCGTRAWLASVLYQLQTFQKKQNSQQHSPTHKSFYRHIPMAFWLGGGVVLPSDTLKRGPWRQCSHRRYHSVWESWGSLVITGQKVPVEQKSLVGTWRVGKAYL